MNDSMAFSIDLIKYFEDIVSEKYKVLLKIKEIMKTI